MAGITIVLIVAGLAIAGCQHAVPVEEARKAPVTLGTPPPPARPPSSPNDPTAVLDAVPLGDTETFTIARERLQQQPPSGNDPAALAHFYFRRGVTSFYLGLTGRAVGDLEQALVYVRQPVPSYQARVHEHEILAYLAWAENSGGSDVRALQRFRQAISAVPRNARGWLLPLYSSFAWTLTRMGDLKSAESIVEELERLEAESRTWSSVSPMNRVRWRTFTLNALAALAEARGKLGQAEELYRAARDEAERDLQLARSYDHDLYQARLARVLTGQRKLLEAEREARTALVSTLRRRGHDSVETGVIVGYLAWNFLAEGRFREAEQLTRAGLDIYDRIDAPADSFLRNVMRRLHAQSLRKQGRLDEALQHFEAIRAALVTDPETFDKQFDGDIDWAYALIWKGRTREALAMLQTTLDRRLAVFGAQHPGSALVLATRATALAKAGDLARALGDFKDAARVLFARTLRPVLGVEFGRSNEHRWYLSIASEYIELLADVRGTPLEPQAGVDPVAETFRISDIGRGRSVQQAVTAAAARAASGEPQLLDLIRRQQDTGHRLAALEVALTSQLTAPLHAQNADNIASLRRDVDAFRKVETELEQQISRDFPAYAQLVSPAPATLERARAVLSPGEALVATWVGSDRTLVWAVPQSGPVAFASVPVKREELCARVSTLRRSLTPEARTLDDIPAFDVQTAYAIYESVLEPVRAGWQGASTLLVVPDQCLAHLPFALLPTRRAASSLDSGALFSGYRAVPWLIRSHAVVALPSVSSLVTLRATPPAGAGRRPFVGFGDPYFSREQAAAAAREPSAPPVATALADGTAGLVLRQSPPVVEHSGGDPLARRAPALDAAQLARLPRLPDTAEEIRSIALALNADLARDVFLGTRATRSALTAVDLSRYRVVAFATHGLVPGDLEGLTQPALALSSPDVTGVAIDGLVTMEDVLGLKLNADWVVLSACNTAAGNGAGAEAVSGLGRAFFYAGARALLVTNWPVETTSARALTTDLFRRQRIDPTLTRARALQQTSTGLIDGGAYVDPRSGRIVFSYAHPIFWAPFTLIGDGG